MQTTKKLGRPPGSKKKVVEAKNKTRKEKKVAKTTSTKDAKDSGDESINSTYDNESFVPDKKDERLVKKVYLEKAAEYEKVVDTEGEDAWARSLEQELPVPNLAMHELFPMTYPEDADSKLMGVFKFTSEDSSSIQRKTIVPLEGLIKAPAMQYWTHTERNIKTEDEHTLSHIPFIGESDKEMAFGEELLEEFEEGIHGVRAGWDQYINDWILFKMLSVLVPKYDSENRPRMALYNMIFELFPNKCSAKKLNAMYIDLQARFLGKSHSVPEPFLQPQKLKKQEDSFKHSFDTCFCLKCNVYDCQTHGLTDDAKSWRYPRRESEFDELRRHTKKIKNRSPCGDKCYKNLKTSARRPVNIRWCKSDKDNKWCECFLIDFLTTRGGLLYCCDAKVAFNNLLRDIGELKGSKEYSCQDIYLYISENLKSDMQLIRPELEVTPMKKKKVDHHQMFRNARYKVGEVSISHQVSPCNHPGKKCEVGVCDCVRDNNVCTKFCKCEDCAHKFPGCKCAAGKCNSKQCSCFLGNFECDPDLCHDCGCAPTMESRTGGTCTNIQLQREFQKKLHIGVSELAGFGCFVGEDCKKGDLISEYCGELISTDECERRGRIYDKLKCSYIFNLNSEQAVDATRVGNLIRFANHCDEANCFPKVMIVNGEHRIGIFAGEDIKKGEEIFFNYSYDRVQKMQFVNKRRRKAIAKAKEEKENNKTKKEKAETEKSKK